jgi:hypothetical protein
MKKELIVVPPSTNILNLFAFKNQDLIQNGFVPVEATYINNHFAKRRCLGQGFYLVRNYSFSGKETPLFGGVTFEEETPLDTKAKVLTSTLRDSLALFYEAVHDAMSRGSRIESRRDGHMSFLAVACDNGVICSGYYDTDAEQSTNGLDMLMFILYRLSMLNRDIDKTLFKNGINHLPSHEGLPPFNPAEVEEEMLNFRKQLRQNPQS